MMRRYTDKELNAMTAEEREALLKQATEEFKQLGQQIEDLLSKKPADSNKSRGRVNN